MPRHTARKSALNHLVDTFFDGSHAKVVTTLLGSNASRLSDDDLDRIAELIASAHPDLAKAAADAVRQWQFSPTLLNGEAVEVFMNVSVSFNLQD